jgi:geranylgeranyl transferase type-2 subunit beta
MPSYSAVPAIPYLVRLADRLSRGLRGLEPERIARHRAFVRSRQQPDGGFAGREGDSDLYYTSFAVRSLAISGGLEPDEARRIGAYLASHSPETLSIVDLLSWLSAVAIVSASGGGLSIQIDADRIAERLESVRTRDGGYARTTAGAAGSTYQSFLVALAYELIGRPLPSRDALVEFVHNRQRDDGGFVEIAPMKRSGTNPTAAAVALLGMFAAIDDDLRDDVRGFLGDVKSDEGGFQANTRIPFADGLSTFTGLLSVQDLGLDDVIDSAAVRAFIAGQLEFPTGGFRGAAWDEQADVEYTFYGLGTLGLLG